MQGVLGVYVSIRLEKVKDWHAVRGQYKHDFRERVPDYVSSERADENVILLDNVGERDIKELMEELINANVKQKRKDMILGYRGILTFSVGAQQKLATLSEKEIAERMKRTLSLLSKHLGGVDYLYAVWHRDESAIHMHFMMMPYQKCSRRSLKATVFYNKQEFSKLQDWASEAWEDLGITRGVRKIERLQRGDSWIRVRHLSVRDMHAMLPLHYLDYRRVKELEQRALVQSVKLRRLRQELERTREELVQTRRNLEQSKRREEMWRKAYEGLKGGKLERKDWNRNK